MHKARGQRVPIIASLPHSGEYIPPHIANLMTGQSRQWLRNTDWYLPHLYDFLPDMGITMLEATHSRYVIDLNRDPKGNLFGDFRSSLVYNKTAHGDDVYSTLPDRQELMDRVRLFHEPYHRCLRLLLDECIAEHGRALLLDLHSFMGPIESDVCIGNANGITCAGSFVSHVSGLLVGEGFGVVVNAPFSGGYITRHYANMAHAETMQIELRYTRYLDCTRIDDPVRPSVDDVLFSRTQKALMRVFASLHV